MTETQYLFKNLSTGQQVPLAPLMSVGRSEDSALRLLEGQPSRHHAQITVGPGQVFVEDLGSMNGTFVNGRRLDAKVKFELTAGDRVRFDLEEFVFVDNGVKPKDDDKTVYRPPDPDKTVFRPTPKPPRTDPTQRLEVEAREPAIQPAAADRKPAPVDKPRPADVRPADVRPADARPADVRPADARPADARPADPRPAEKQALPGAFADPPPDATILVHSQKPQHPPGSAAPAPAPAAGDPPYLWIESGNRAGQKVELTADADAKRTWRVGSNESSRIRFQDPGVSAQHATLHQQDGTWVLTDDLSVNGTFVNDKKILRSYLAPGDRVRFGPVECRFYIPPAAGERARAGTPLRRFGLIAAVAFALTLALLFAAYRFIK
jgi:pSer/pThr/pTyr-binding forkhead associated (FHA) protein